MFKKDYEKYDTLSTETKNNMIHYKKLLAGSIINKIEGGGYSVEDVGVLCKIINISPKFLYAKFDNLGIERLKAILSILKSPYEDLPLIICECQEFVLYKQFFKWRIEIQK